MEPKEFLRTKPRMKQVYKFLKRYRKFHYYREVTPFFGKCKAPEKQAWTILNKLVKAGLAQKKGTAYRYVPSKTN